MGDDTVPATSGAEHNEPTLSADAGGEGSRTQGASGTDTRSTTSIPPQQHTSDPVHPFSSQLEMSPSPHLPPQPSPYNLASMGQALPQEAGLRPNQYSPNSQHRFGSAGSSMMSHHVGHYAGHSPVPMAGQAYYVHQHPPMAPYHAHGQGPQAQAQSSPGLPPRQGMAYYPNQMVMNYPQSHQYYYTQPNQYPTHPVAHPTPISQPVQPQYVPINAPTTDSQTRNIVPDLQRGSHQAPRIDDAEVRQSAVRGPPRKPRQSGHAIWVGNLPPQTDLMSLVHHVCREAPGLESLFLISKSNCAFANFKDEATCIAGQQKLHDSKFQSVRLVSRLRKSAAEAQGANAPSASTSSAGLAATDPGVAEADEQEKGQEPTSPVIPDPQKALSGGDLGASTDKFFVLKSLTIEDLGLSVQTGVWATQSHNEEALNNAFKAADNVYLVFSANKSGEYFGYARMTSEINQDPAAAVEFAPTSQDTTNLDLPKAIPTEATEYAPKGRIIDDSTRGTIFWETEREGAEDSDDETDAGSIKSGQGEDGAKAWGKPFKLEWLSTTRLPFYRTRGLRNPWNSNREVKIARDGTELEPSVGRRLIGLFNRIQSPGVSTGPGGVRPGSMSGAAGPTGSGGMQGYGLGRTFGP